MAWRVAQSLVTLLAEVNAAYPGRDKRTDGAISGYPGSISSHNINSQGVVCALDITTGDYPGGISPSQGMALAEQIRIAIRDQPRGIPCYPIHHMEPPYVPYAGPWIATANQNWAWQPYGGSDGHTSHIHVSVDWDIYTGGAPSGQADYDTTLPWGITTVTGQSTDITPIDWFDMASLDDLANVLKRSDVLDAIAYAVLQKEVPWYGYDGVRPATGRTTTNLQIQVGYFDSGTSTVASKADAARVSADAATKAVTAVPSAVLNQPFTANGKTVNLAGILGSLDAKPAGVVSLTDAQVSAMADQIKAGLPAATVAALAAKLA